MSHIHFTDEIVKEYLLFRGFSGALKSFESDLKVDKDRGFRVDKVVDSLLQAVYNYDLIGLKEIWTHLSIKLFTKLDQNFSVAIRKLENAILKFYLVNAVENNKHDKVTEFFTKMASELSNQLDWKDWFSLPFTKNPEENPIFAVYFSRQWHESLFVSLYNFLAAVYQNLPQPTLSSFEESATKMAALQRENDMLRRGLSNLLTTETDKRVCTTDDLSDLMDDFHAISQETKVAETQAKTIKSFMKRSSGPSTSPKSTQAATKISVSKSTKRSSSIDARSPGNRQKDRDSSLDTNACRAMKDQMKTERAVTCAEGSFLFLSQDEYNEHNCEIVALEVNARGNMVASLDRQGNLRAWNAPPSCKTVAVFPAWPEAKFLRWVLHHERYLLCADCDGVLRLLDFKEVHQVWEISLQMDAGSGLQDVTTSPTESSALLLCSGKLMLLDLKTKRIEKTINTPPNVTCSAFTPNGQYIIAGCRDGSTSIVDLKRNEIIDSFPEASAPVRHILVSSDQCFYMDSNHKLYWLSYPSKEDLSSCDFPGDAQVPEFPIRPFCSDSSGSFLLTLGNNSGVIFKITDGKINKCLELGGHKTKVTCIDWCFANQCATCLTASSDGNIRISTLLIDNVIQR